MDAGRVAAGEPWGRRPTWRTVVPGLAAVLAANAPLAIWASAFWGRGAGDSRTHAAVANAIARQGLRHGWTEVYGGGFALGPHYPLAGWGLSALLIRTGFAPMVAVDLIGFVSVLAVPVAAFLLGLRLGARPLAALACAFFLSWISPGGYFVSGTEAFYGQGLLSQALVMPALVFLVAAVASDGPPWRATLWAATAVAFHPQVATGCIAVLLVPALSTRDRGVVSRTLRAGVAMGLIGAALYGPGIATLKVPFGWPPMEAWKTIGFGTDRLGPWLLRGQLLDVGRAPVLTALWAGSMLVVLARPSRAAARAAAIASLVVVTLSVSGSALEGMGAPGAFLSTFLQPLRVLALVPLVASATVLVAVEEAAPIVASLCQRAATRIGWHLGRRRWVPLLSQAVALGLVAWGAFPIRLVVANLVRDKVRSILDSFTPDAPCGAPVSNTEPRAVKTWVSSLAGGRLWYDDTSETSVECEFSTGFEIDSAVPIAVTSGVGAHVGVHQVAFHQLAPDRMGSSRRAEALGVRHLLLFAGEPAGPGWDIVHRGGNVVLAERAGGTDVVGVGCIESIWTGSDEALRARLLSDLITKRGAHALLDPHSLVALETAERGVEWTERRADLAGCSVEGAEVRELPREAGAHEADVATGSPVDVVIRVAAFPTWRVFVDGREAKTTTVAPGFPSVRVAAGQHHLEAVVSPLPGYLRGIVLALLGVVLCSLPKLPFRARPGTRSPATGSAPSSP